MPQQPQGPEPPDFVSLKRWVDTFRFLAVLAALTVMVYFRRGLGARIIKVGWIGPTCFVLLLVPAFCEPSTNPKYLAGFAILTAVLALIHRVRAWWASVRGVALHSYYFGDSVLRKLPWPKFMLRHRRIERYVDPFYCVGIAYVAGFYSTALAVWIVIAAFCLGIAETTLRNMQIETDMDMVDGMVHAHGQAEVVDRFGRCEAADSRRPRPIATGLSEDIERKVSERGKSKSP